MTRLLIVDDSALMRRLLYELFADAGGFEISVGRDGREALAMLEEIKPQVVVLDINMPGLDGLQCLDEIMLRRPCPVVMFSSLTSDGAEQTVQALALGAVDYLAKPTGAISLKLAEFGPQLVEKVRAASLTKVSRARRLRERLALNAPPAAPAAFAPRQAPARTGQTAATGAAPRLVLVGASTGGPPALDALLGPLPERFPCPIVVAQHMPATFTGPLAHRLDRICALHVVEVARPERLEPGHVYIARGEADVIISRRKAGLFALPAPASSVYRWHPSVDRLVASALEQLPASDLLGVLLTGMGSDGAAEMARIYADGGTTIAEAEESAVVWGMPGELVRKGGAQIIAPLEEIASRLLARVSA
ncbi:two-component system response regulator protein-glutamate methylesterase [Phenylobacterium sp. Root77]|uniref:chemotaxis-specific protein-glutamate methyltransferase CheB n=1 Tax=unclassified Phenylobacterium TaxID=2640670 RepID=UPI0006FE885B|nr:MULTISPECIES: chemotaxis-specific protein-glutamate methyltransferase CheB [unclassified Phenylobacterium]KQW66955.1 two-component system response regulator protein-glutamate methylesterase [Phenylobacterium sp. Root1277]KQW89648.1 two-component system response regulator protein-glutamate methylesterase [Phenylobacterium sp. Root1290]KRC43483.1 two-component system response regulator protein-glutamate methylesterase [Phenylobacterium sp. Root77]